MTLEAPVRDPLTIVREYLSSQEPRVRGNACAALAAIGSRESLTELRDLALADPAPDVRARAAKEIEQLDPAPRALCIELILDAMGKPDRQRAASELLTRLRAAGAPVRLPPWPLARRLRLALRGRPEMPWRWASFLRAWLAAALGSFVGAVVLLVGLESQGLATRKVQSLLLLAALAAASLLGMAAVQFSRPLRTYLDARLGSLVEIAAVSLGTLLPVLVLTLLYLFFWLRQSEASLGKAGALLLVGVLLAAMFVAAIRGGTLIGAAAVPARRWRGLAQTAVGAALGAVLLTGLFQGLIHLPRIRSDLPAAEFTTGWWLLLLPAAFGIAAAIARLDDGPPDSGRALRVAAAAASLLLIGGLVLVWPWQAAGDTTTDELLLERLSRSEALPEWGPYDETPVSRSFQVAFPQKVTIKAPADRTFLDDHDIVLTVWKGSKLLEAPSDDPEETTLEIREPGEYRAEVRNYDFEDELLTGNRPGGSDGGQSLGESFFTVATRVAHLDMKAVSDAKEGFRIDIVLNAEPSFALLGQVPRLLEEGKVAAAVTAFDRAAKLTPALADSIVNLERICRVGSLRGSADSVLPKCERAARLAPIPFVLDSRGIARAMTGRLQEAAADFEAVSGGSKETVVRKQRAQWVERLRRGQNPLSPKTVDELLRQAPSRRYRRQAPPELIHAGIESAEDGRPAEAFRLWKLAEAEEAEPRLRTAREAWAQLCWYAALTGSARDTAAVVQTCERAEKISSALPVPLGLALAHQLAGDRKAAAKDLQSYSLSRDGVLSKRRDQWVETLLKGGDPFTPQELGWIEQTYPLPDLAQVEEKVLKSIEP